MNKILFFAHLRDAVGEETIQLDLNGKTVAELKEFISEKYEIALTNVMTAINEEFASDEEVIQQGDAIAFIPPVSGG
ncbi:molybdopterin converting factor subunit 1 [Cytobacillus depressus]|uniref:Molybdopterin synthase sulfur carrier subunit n=1 Tax=Cytobacillus depressus TaxID=1602942 RepID=A0A6L3V8C0_9BACI|nr:molybdopterin converting factor subunit 1 [Cytobacillus depressus]KAB2333144.1 molybdopterin converting factor subunit 1 [Cytobacillus depressus]